MTHYYHAAADHAPDPDSALSRLKHDERCILVPQDGTHQEATWSKNTNRFHYHDGTLPRVVRADEVPEWWPASVKF
jgi:hypothetical protein